MDDDNANSRKKSSRKGTSALRKCDNCHRKLPKSELRQCSGCHVDSYCSRDCQRQAWPSHKSACPSFSLAKQQMAVHHDKKIQFKTLQKWIEIWANTIGYFGALGMNPTRNPGVMGTHGLFLELESAIPRPTERSKWLTIKKVSILRRAEIQDVVKGINKNLVPSEGLKLPIDESPAATSVLITVVLHPGVFQAFQIKGPDAAQVRQCTGGSVRNGDLMAQTWESTLLYYIANDRTLPSSAELDASLVCIT